MGKPTGFLEYDRCENQTRPPLERMQDWEEFHIPAPDATRREQGARCMNCGIPFCQAGVQFEGKQLGCPLHNLIPEWNDMIMDGNYAHALARLLKTNNFPEFTGRVCPAFCEQACTCGMYDTPITVHDNELSIIEYAFQNGLMKPRFTQHNSGKNIVVIGSGPSGLAAADQLNHRGHSVTVIEKHPCAGGILMYGIPNMKLPKKIIERRIRLMEAEGIGFLLNTEAAADAIDAYDAVLLCGGSRKPRSLAVPHMDARGVHFAVDYLTAATQGVLNGADSSIAAQGKRVIVVGGGDTGNDCVGTALRQGCLSVTQLEMMPKAPETRQDGNPWPEWPRVLRTDYGQAEAIAVQGGDPRRYETTVSKILTSAANELTAIETVRLQFANGRPQPIPGSEQTLPCDLLLIAAGFIGCEDQTAQAFGLAADSRGRLMPENGSHHIKDKLFSAGDMRTGQSLVVRALADGRAAAKEIHQWLEGKQI